MTSSGFARVASADQLLNATTATCQRSWSGRDAALYALSVGAGGDDPTQDLDYTLEGSPRRVQTVLPGFASIVGRRHPDTYSLLPGVDHTKVLQVGFEIEWPTPGVLPTDGEASIATSVSALSAYPRGLSVTFQTRAIDGAGRLLFVTRSRVSIRDYVVADAQPGVVESFADVPAHHASFAMHTHPEQALLYRLLGDVNPLHVEPSVAAKAGFSRPILHGLCTYGYAARGLMKLICPDRPDRMKLMTSTFTSPVIPGDSLSFRVWDLDDRSYGYEVATARGPAIRAGEVHLH
jgi:acyl dehydratase